MTLGVFAVQTRVQLRIYLRLAGSESSDTVEP
jgi:hypothetical protein